MVRQTITHLTQPNPPQQSETASSMNPRIKQDNPSARLSGAGPDRYAHTCRGVCLRDRQTSGDGDRRGGGIGLAGDRISDEIPPKIAFSERKVNSNLKNGIPKIPGGIPDFRVENIIFLLQMLQTYEELNNLIEYFLYLLYIAMYNAY